MGLKNDILNNWKTDIIGYAHAVESLDETAYPCWTVKYPNSYGVAIPYTGNECINEVFSNARIKSDTLIISNGGELNAIILTADFSVAKGPFSTLCEELVDPGDNGENRLKITASPVLWWKEWKDLLGNRNVDERVYDTLGELCALKYLTAQGEDAEWGGPTASTYDIEIPSAFIEVKSTISRSKKEITISNPFQLDPTGKRLSLFFCQFEDSAINGLSIDSVVSELISMGYDGDYLESRLSAKGFEKGMSTRKQTFILHGMLRYEIDDEFPRITPKSFIGGVMPEGISKITYTVSLDGLSAIPLV